MFCVIFLFFKQKTAYEVRISDWSSDVCSSDLHIRERQYFIGLPDAPDGDGGTGERRAQERTGPFGQRGVGSASGGADDGVEHGVGARLERQRRHVVDRKSGD